MSWQALKDKLDKAAEDLVVLNIDTIVVKPSDTTPPSNVTIVEIHTEIEQLTGDVKNTFSESAFTLEYGEALRRFHDEQRALGIQLLARNLEVIRQLFAMIREFGSNEPSPPPGP